MTVRVLDADTLLSGIVEGIGQPFYAVDRDWRIILYNSDAARHFGRPAAEMLGRRLWDLFPDDIGTERGRIIADAMQRGTTVKGEAYSMTGTWVSYCMFPLGDGMGIVLRDVMDRRTAERHRDEAVDALQRRTAELEAVLETVPTAVWFTYDPRGYTLVTNRRAAELLRLPHGPNASLAAPSGTRPPFRFLRDGVELPTRDLPIQRAILGEEVRDEILELRFDSGDRRTLLLRAAPLRGPDGAIQGAVAAAADVTERHRYEAHLKLLLEELNHRVKNTLAIVQSIATQTFRGDADPQEARRRFEDRLLALSGTHDILTREGWQRASLREVVDEAIAPHCGVDPARFEIDGPEVVIRPKHAVALAMALHELCTNAAKFGALSTPDGRIAIGWRVADRGDGRWLSLAWRERGGPPVPAPTRRGFGSRLVEQGLAHDLGGAARIDFKPTGLECRIEARLDAVADVDDTVQFRPGR